MKIRRCAAVMVALALNACSNGALSRGPLPTTPQQAKTPASLEPSNTSKLEFDVTVPSDVTAMKSIAIVLRPLTGNGKQTLYDDLVGPLKIIRWRVSPGLYYATFATFSGPIKKGKPSGRRLSANQSVPVHVWPSGPATVKLTVGTRWHFVRIIGADNTFYAGTLFASKCVTTHRGALVVLDPSARIVIGVNAPVGSLKSEDPKLAVERDPSAGPNTYIFNLAAIPAANEAFNLTITEKPKTGRTRTYTDPLRVDNEVCGIMTEFPLPTSVSQPVSIAAGSDGNVWFLETGANKIGRVTTTGTVTEYPVPTGSSGLETITGGPDKALWFTEYAADKIGRVSTDGVVTEYATGITASSAPDGITAGPDNALWFTEYAGNRVARITTAGTVTEFPTTTSPSHPVGITVGPQTGSGLVEQLWFTESVGKIGTITTSGTMSELSFASWNSYEPYSIAAITPQLLLFTDKATNSIGLATLAGPSTDETLIPTASSDPDIAALGPDGAVWFTEKAGNKLGRYSTDGVITEYAIPTASSAPAGIVTGPDGSIWFTELNGNKIGRIQ